MLSFKWLYVSCMFLLSSCSAIEPSTQYRGCTTERFDGGATISCTDGSKATVYDGMKGDTGNPGEPGKDGSSCHAETIPTGVSIVCDNGSTAQITNGINGIDGNITSIVLCPNIPGKFKETLLLMNHSYFGVYADLNSGLVFLVMLSPGKYITTDGRGCSFTITKEGMIANVIE